MRRLAAELLGTFFLVLVGPGAAMVDAYSHGTLGQTGIALAFGLVVFALVVTLGSISAHVNPAVTIALSAGRKFPAVEVLPYIGAQCLGAVAAAEVLRGCLGPLVARGVTRPAIGPFPAFVIEWLLSFALMFVIASVAAAPRSSGQSGLAIGGTVGFCALLGPLTGSSMNPARSFGPAVAAAEWGGHWLYWLAPITGMLTAVAAHHWLTSPVAGRPKGRQMPSHRPESRWWRA